MSVYGLAFGGVSKAFRRTGSVGTPETHRPNFAPSVRAVLPEKRSSSEGDLRYRFESLLPPPTSAGAIVSEVTALNVSCVTACVKLLADMVAKLPIKLYQKTDGGRKEITDHAGVQLIGRFPGDLHTSFELRQIMEVGKGLGGNGYARVYRDAYGDPVELEWLAPNSVNPQKLPQSRIISYQVNGVPNFLTRRDIIHVRQFSTDGVRGVSPIRILRDSIGTSLAQTEAAAKLMRDGAHFPGYLTAPQTLSKDQLVDARSEWDKNHAGARNAGRVPIMHGGFEFHQTNGMSMVDAQFLESRRFELQEIARAYGIPTFLIGDTTNATSFGTGIEQMNLGFLNYSLDPHLVGWEQSLDYTLLSTDDKRAGMYFKFDRHALMAVALEALASFYEKMRSIGVYSVNDIRAKLDENKLTDGTGDDYSLPFNNTGGSAKAKTETPQENVA